MAKPCGKAQGTVTKPAGDTAGTVAKPDGKAQGTVARIKAVTHQHTKQKQDGKELYNNV